MKKILLTTAAAALLSTSAMAQGIIGNPVKMNLPITNIKAVSPANGGKHIANRCGTLTPSAEWDAAFNKDVEKFKAEQAADMANGRTTALTYTIPIVFHVIYGSEAVGTYPNIAQAQINSQVTVLNQDYAGNGYQSGTYPATAFAAYAAAATNSVSAASKDGSGRVGICNTGITFCLATKNPTGVTLTEPGIDRVSYVAKGWANPNSAAYNSQSTFQAYIDGTIKPGTIWDVTKYFNVWLTDENPSAGLLGYSTFPPSSGLTGIPGSTGTTTTDGCWFLTNVCGSANIYAAGTYDATYRYGRTICHECGHYLGLRHPWGDAGQCGGTDYCNDTPPEKGTAGPPAGCYYGTPTYPSQAGSCTFGGQTNTNGDMFMNIMDYTDDIAMYMFTNDQATRMHTAMANSPYRTGLSASATTLCNLTASTPTAAFTPPSSICATQNVVFNDASLGTPTTWTWTVASSVGVTITTASVQSPTINFTNPGTYTVTDRVANSAGNSTVSHTVTVTSCTISGCDTVTHITNSDTLALYTTGTSTSCTSNGYVNGTNCYGFTGLSEAYALTDFPTGSLQIKGAIILFYSHTTGTVTVGTHGVATHTATTLSMVNSATSPSVAAVASKAITFANIATTTGVTHVDYAGNPLLGYASPIILPYVAMFTTPVSLTTAFFMNLSLTPTAGDTVAIFSGHQGHNATNTAWLDYGGSWMAYSSAFGKNFSLAIIPIACSPGTGISIENNYLGSNINLFPNPNSGQFTFAISLTEATNLNFTVVNTLGQVVYTKTESNVLNTVLSCDLSHLAKGVYYANIMDSNNNRTVKKIIIE